MRDIVSRAASAAAQIDQTGRRFRFGLTGRLIATVSGFIMLAEVLIYVPAVSNMRYNWLHIRLSAAYTAALMFESAPQGMLDQPLSEKILSSVGARLIVLDRDGTRQILAAGRLPEKVDEVDDLRTWNFGNLLSAAMRTLTAAPGRVITVLTHEPKSKFDLEVTMDEAPLQDAMYAYSGRILIYSLLVSILAAGFVTLALHRMILRPVRRLTTSIMNFGADPGDRSRIIEPSKAAHEIGQAERALAVMEEALALELSQKKNLANLGLAVAKINHDMRNMLTSAQILTDRLANVTDPLAQRLAPKLVATLDRAIRFCQATLTYGRAVDDPPRPRRLALRPLVADAAESVAPVAHGPVRIVNEVPEDLDLTADPEQMFRILMNLMRNGVEALERAGSSGGHAPRVGVRAWRENSLTIIEVHDNGPGIPAAVRPKLFAAFQNSMRPGGTGLGLAIVADLIRAHGGTITLASEGGEGEETGACFRISMPWLPEAR